MKTGNKKDRVLPPRPRKVLNDIMQAAGILKGRELDGVAYQRRIRREWEERLKRQWQLGLKRTRHVA